MRLTVINNQNEDSFLPLMTYYEADGGTEDCLRIGVIDSDGYASGALVARIDKKIIDAFKENPIFKTIEDFKPLKQTRLV